MKMTLRMLLGFLVVGVSFTIATPSADAQPVHRKLPNTIENRKPAIKHTPFTVEEFRKIRKDVKATTSVRLRDGKELPISKYLEELNQVENQLNGYGYSLRQLVKEKKQPIVLDETRIRVKGKDAYRVMEVISAETTALAIAATVTPSLTGALRQFTTNEVVWTVLDPSVFGAQLVWRTGSRNKPTTIETTDELVLKGWAFNNSTNLIVLNAAANVPSGLAPNDTQRTAKVHFDILGAMVKDVTANDSGQNQAVASYSTPRISYNSPSLDYQTFIGPVPVVLKIGFSVNGSAAMTARSEVYSSSSDVTSSGGVAVNARALAGVSIIGAGVQTSIDALSFHYHYLNKSNLTRMPLPTSQTPSPPWNWTSVGWQYGNEYEIESGSGRMSVVIEVDLWILGTVSLSKDFVKWDGYTWSQGYVESPAQTLTRPAGCGAPLFRNAMCTIPSSAAGCVDLIENESNCGGCGVTCSAGQTCKQGSCYRPPEPPPGHTCPTGSDCCEELPNGRCIGLCIRPGQHCP